MKYIQFFFVCISFFFINVKKTTQELFVETMETNKTKIELLNPTYSSSSIILKSQIGRSGYKTSTFKTLLIQAPPEFGLFAAVKNLDLRPEGQDYLSVIGDASVFTYSNHLPYRNPKYFPSENIHTIYSPRGQINVTFVTGGFLPLTNSYGGFELIFTVQANNSKCRSHYFYCDNGKCISYNLLCDGHNHCGDQSDQKYCDNRYTPKRIKNIGWIAGGVFFVIVGLACAVYIMMKKISRPSTTERIITHPPPTQISYPQPGAGYPAPPPPYSQGINQPTYH